MRSAVVEPHDRGLLDVGDGQQVYWESRAVTPTVCVVELHNQGGR